MMNSAKINSSTSIQDHQVAKKVKMPCISTKGEQLRLPVDQTRCSTDDSFQGYLENDLKRLKTGKRSVCGA